MSHVTYIDYSPLSQASKFTKGKLLFIILPQNANLHKKIIGGVYMNNPNKKNIWKDLENQARTILSQAGLQNSADELHPNETKISACNISLDFSHQKLSHKAFDQLLALGESCQLKLKIESLMNGAIVNKSENRPALHTALRQPEDQTLLLNNQNVIADVTKARNQIKNISEQLRSKQWLGFSGKPMTDIVNIGIGGSDLGPRFCIQALSEYTSDELNYHFVSDVDPNGFEYAIKKLNPETTLFIISSKSFTTPETMYNARKALAWIGPKEKAQQHFIAVTANIDKAKQAGFKNILPIWEWVGGRYSFCSAINLISAIAMGYDHFQDMLAGAYSMDKHFKETALQNNLPVLLALIGVWNNNFLAIHNHLILTYALQFEKLVPYIQQLDMESNGKSIDNQGNTVNYATGPIVWGGLGNQAQHSFYQLLCQGTHKVTADFITLKSFDDEIINDMAAAKIKILTQGVNQQDDPSSFIPGNTPLNKLQLKDCTPYTIGALVALYEHKIFTQSVIWDINPFDQPGVESAKRHSLITKQLQTA